MRVVEKIQGYCLTLWYNISIFSRIDDVWKRWKVSQLRHKNSINVVFVATFLSQWKYQRLFEMMSNHPKFNPTILLAPSRHFEEAEDYKKLRKHFEDNHIPFVDFERLAENQKNIRKYLEPDILFYIQPYYFAYDKRIDSHSFKDKLICHSFYSYQIYDTEWVYNLEFHNRAWKLFHICDVNIELAKKYAINKGRNVEIVGYLAADYLIGRECKNVWKKQEKEKKKIIWSPHFGITADSALQQANFLNMADFMLKLARKYKDKVQFSFKPHPELFRLLCENPEWGEKRAREYYSQWETMPNTQLDYGNYYDLFLTSDAMINDSGSFTAEYIYSLKPAINCFKDFKKATAKMSMVGKEAVNAQYRGSTEEEIDDFIDKVIIKGDDVKAEERKQFYLKYLLPPCGKTVSENIFDVLKKEFHL